MFKIIEIFKNNLKNNLIINIFLKKKFNLKKFKFRKKLFNLKKYNYEK